MGMWRNVLRLALSFSLIILVAQIPQTRALRAMGMRRNFVETTTHAAPQNRVGEVRPYNMDSSEEENEDDDDDECRVCPCPSVMYHGYLLGMFSEMNDVQSRIIVRSHPVGMGGMGMRGMGMGGMGMGGMSMGMGMGGMGMGGMGMGGMQNSGRRVVVMGPPIIRRIHEDGSSEEEEEEEDDHHDEEEFEDEDRARPEMFNTPPETMMTPPEPMMTPPEPPRYYSPQGEDEDRERPEILPAMMSFGEMESPSPPPPPESMVDPMEETTEDSIMETTHIKPGVLKLQYKKNTNTNAKNSPSVKSSKQSNKQSSKTHSSKTGRNSLSSLQTCEQKDFSYAHMCTTNPFTVGFLTNGNDLRTCSSKTNSPNLETYVLNKYQKGNSTINLKDTETQSQLFAPMKAVECIFQKQSLLTADKRVVGQDVAKLFTSNLISKDPKLKEQVNTVVKNCIELLEKSQLPFEITSNNNKAATRPYLTIQCIRKYIMLKNTVSACENNYLWLKQCTPFYEMVLAQKQRLNPNKQQQKPQTLSKTRKQG